MNIIRINDNGQIIIPQKIRTEINLKPNMKLCIYTEEEKIIIEPLKEDPINVLVELFKGNGIISKEENNKNEGDKNFT